jgi:hypothetical protein
MIDPEVTVYRGDPSRACHAGGSGLGSPLSPPLPWLTVVKRESFLTRAVEPVSGWRFRPNIVNRSRRFSQRARDWVGAAG